MALKPIPIIDIFAGPGGLGEGFSRVGDGSGNPVFRTALSIEKEELAHQTLMLRAFARLAKRTSEAAWKDYRFRLGHDISVDQLLAKYPGLTRHAANEAWHQELGPDTAADVRRRIDATLPDQRQNWILIGGPPCQAYSLAGRSRNKGKAQYVFEKDDRAQLYLEYLQILADHRPAVFVMENVKGLLSATFHAESMFELIRRDLQEPATALGEAGRACRFRPKYELHSVSQNRDDGVDLFGERADAESFLVRAEDHGTPQARHRVIIVGIRKDLNAGQLARLGRSTAPTVLDVIRDLPKIRSGLSSADSPDRWRGTIRGLSRAPWLRLTPPEVHTRISRIADRALHANSGRGGEALLRENPPKVMPRWYGGAAQGLKWIWQHSSRGHIPEDLARYLFASTWAEANSSSPHLGDFPPALLPEHRNAKAAAAGGAFSDRFRVQLGDRVATTITSHISKDGHYYIHPDPSQCRSLTVREAARLQTFPDDYFFCGPRTGQYVQVGNAVPPFLAWQIASLIGEALGRTCDRHPLP